MEHILDIEEQLPELYEIFRKMRESNTILFLGAGASVDDKKYLSAQIIELYEQYLGKKLDEPNIVNWIDILSADPDFDRKHFDDFVFNLLRKLKVTEGHKILATIPWNEIITTNYDLLVEQAYDEISNSVQKLYDIKPIKNIKQLNYKESNTEVKYIKLNGCMQDKSMYPFAFSSNDFDRLKSFYKNVLNELKNLSPKINFLTIGYSFSDAFGKELLQKFDSYNFRERKWMINVDPFPNENALHYYKNNKIRIVKLSFQDFFRLYLEWEHNQDEAIVKKRGISIVDSKNQYLTFSPKLLLDLEGIVKQLSLLSIGKERFINDVEFYKGEEPNYSLIARGVDVIKGKYIEDFREKIVKISSDNKSTILPIFFITGDFGIGKSTFTLRLIYELCSMSDFDGVAFEIIDPNRIRKELLLELITNSRAKNFIIYCDDIEVESHFKILLELQRELSIEQIQGCNVFFILPIRQNMLEKYKLRRALSQGHELNLGGKLEEEELSELLDRLRTAQLVHFRDANEKQLLVRRVQREYGADSFISLMAIVTSGKHENDLIDSYNQLSTEAQKALLYTALLHKHKLLMPASLLKQNVSSNWQEFIQNVVKAEGKGLLIQEEINSHGTNPDLYFRTKHPLIASKLISRFIPNKDKEFSLYEKLLRTIEPGQSNSFLVGNLLKGFIRGKEFNDYQINRLFDAAYTKLSDDPYFLLNYATNLQSRRIIYDLKRALEILVYAESLLENRNHRFIHRRGVVSFELAKLHLDIGEKSYCDYYISEAKDLFYTKQLLDPFSSYSYVDYIRLLIWEVENRNLDEEDLVQRQIQIEELFDLAHRIVTDGIERVESLSQFYADCLRRVSNNKDYEEYLQNLYENFRLRPFACILLYNHYFFHNRFEMCGRYIDEMEYYQDTFEVIKFLFKYYGRRLFDANTRVKLLRISRENPQLEKDNMLRYNFFNFIAESYNYQFSEGRRYLSSIQSRGFNINPDFHEIWRDPDGQEMIFDGIVIKQNRNRYKSIKVTAMQQTFKLLKGNYDKYIEGQKVKVRLHFYLFGLIAEIIGDVEEDI